MASATSQIPPLDLNLSPPHPKSYHGGKKGLSSTLISVTDDDELVIPKQHGGKKGSSLAHVSSLDEEDSLVPKLHFCKKGTIHSNLTSKGDEENFSYQKSFRKVNSTGLVPINDDEDTVPIKSYGGKKGAPAGLITITDEGEIIPLTTTPRVPLHQQGSKRGAPGPLVTTSDEEENDSLPPTPRSNVTSSSSVHQHAYEHDHDYENVASPSGSSTASGPVYVRPPGFTHHAQEIKKVKKKKTSAFLDVKAGLKKRAPTPPKVRPRRETVPMRLRALPQSFWKQPNVPNPVSPATVFPSLPPLGSRDPAEDITDVRPITPPEEKERQKKQQTRQPDRKIFVTGDTDLLLKHLFDGVVDDKKNSPQIKRGRPRKVTIPKPTTTKGLLSGEDPYLVDAVTEKLFPQLSLETRQGHGGATSLQLVTLREGDKSVTLPSLSIEQNYSQMLSELAMHI